MSLVFLRFYSCFIFDMGGIMMSVVEIVCCGVLAYEIVRQRITKGAIYEK